MQTWQPLEAPCLLLTIAFYSNNVFRDAIHAGMLLCSFVFMATLRLYLVNRGAPQRLSLCALFEVQTQTCLKGELRNSGRFSVSFSLLPYPQLPLEFPSAYRF